MKIFSPSKHVDAGSSCFKTGVQFSTSPPNPYFYDIIIIMKKEEILSKLKELKPIYQEEGLEIVGVFGSYAKETNTKYSDIDIAYKLDYEKFSQKYTGGFSKLLRIDSIKDELKSIFKQEIDFVPDSNKKIMKDLIYV